MTRERKDYCGPNWMPSWIRRFFSSKFNASCRLHDWDYSPPHKYTRKEADKRFYEHMKRQSGKNPLWRLTALFYYISVRVFGKSQYGEGKKDG